MAIRVYRCCFCFSLRLGAMIIALFGVIKVCPLIGYTTYVLVVSNSTHVLENILKDLSVSKGIFEFFLYDLNANVTFAILSGILIWYVITCVSLAIAAYLCLPKFIYPYLVTHLLGILLSVILYCLLFQYLMHMTSISSNVLQTEMFGLGYIILYLSLAAFYISFDIYVWICSYNLTILLNQLHAKILSKRKAFERHLYFEKMSIQTPIAPVDGVSFKKPYY